MDFATASDPALRAALWVGLGAAALSVGVLAAVALLRLRLMARLARERRFAERWRPVLAACAAGVPDALPAVAREDAMRFLILWVRAQESLRGEVRSTLVDLAARIGVDRLAVGLLASGEPRRELVALVALGHMRVRSLLPLAEALLEVEQSVISLAAAQAMVRIDAQYALPRVLDAAARRNDWPIARLAAMLGECDAADVGVALCEAIESRLRVSPDAGVARLLRLRGVARAEALRPAVLRALEAAASAEIAAAALDALWHPVDAAVARAYLAHKQWFVRLGAAKALGRLGEPADVERLAPMLSDPSWWVRYRAAQAVARLPGVTGKTLEQMRAATRDPFAAQMLAQVIAEGGAA